MLEVLINFICAIMMAFLGYYVIKKIINDDEKISFKVILILIINSVIIAGIHYIKFNAFTSVFNFIINTITYKLVFNKKYSDSFVYTTMLMIIIFISELIWLSIFVNFASMNVLRENLYLYLLTNIIIVITTLIILKIGFFKSSLSKFYKILTKKERIINIIFLILFVISISSLMYNLTMNFHRNFFFLSNVVITTGTILIVIIYMYNKEEYNRLTSEYNDLLINVKELEEWIEKEQFTRHEYKNQLAVLYDLSNEEEVKFKIKEIINENLNLTNEIVSSLSALPKGGLKGLIYYKTIVAKNHKIKVTINVSIASKGILNKLNRNQISLLCKLIGVFYDNAIDAAKESRKKIILIEIYELKNHVNIVISNTFKKSHMVANRFEKGSTTKGEGHGSGLYFAKKILDKSPWLTEKQEIIDNYYIETITINKNTSKK